MDCVNARSGPAGPVGVPVAGPFLWVVILLVVVFACEAFCVVCVWLIALCVLVA